MADINDMRSSSSPEFKDMKTLNSRNSDETIIPIRSLRKFRQLNETCVAESYAWEEQTEPCLQEGVGESKDYLARESNDEYAFPMASERQRGTISLVDGDFEGQKEIRMSQNMMNDKITSSESNAPVKKIQRKISTRELLNPEQCREEHKSTPRGSSTSQKSMTAKELQNLIERRTKEQRMKLVEKFIGAITLHGYAQFHEATGVRKVLWAITLAAMAFFIVRLTYLSYCPSNYYKQVIEFETEKVQEINFPTVTLCNFSPKYEKNMHKIFPIDITEEEFLQFYRRVMSNRLDKKEPYKDYESFSAGRALKERVLRELKAKGYSSFTEILRLFEKHEEEDIHSHLINKIMLDKKCIYENKPCNFKKDFTSVYRHSSQSLCQQFNYYDKDKASLVSSGNDRENGLTMFWDISGINYHYDYGLDGLLVEVHPYGTPHHLIDHRHTIYLQPGALTNIDIVEVSTKRLPPPFKPNCGQGTLKVIRDFPYTEAICEVDCFLQNILDKCGCVNDQFSKHVGDVRICNVSEVECTFEASTEIHCHGCPIQCEAIRYKLSTSRLGIGNNLIYEVLKSSTKWRNKSEVQIQDYIRRNIVGFRIGFKSLEKQRKIYKEAVPWHQRISMLGGMMGLLLGFSVITGFELLFFLFDYLYITLKYRCTQEYLSVILKQENLSSQRYRIST